MWEELHVLKRSLGGEVWCVMDNFNGVRCLAERRDSNNMPVGGRDMNEFNTFIASMELHDITLVGKSFPWYKSNGQAKSWLDRFLVFSGWIDIWVDNTQYMGERCISDHCPLILKNNVVEWGPKPFRVLDCWSSDAKYASFMEQAWEKIEVNGRALEIYKTGGDHC